MPASSETIPEIPSVAPFGEHYDAWLCDIWGVMHNGERPFPRAVRTCERFRQGGGVVVLISNSPRPHGAVARQLHDIGVPEAAYDAIVTSGDVTRQVLTARKGEPLFHLGPERDKPLLEGLDLQLTGLAEARYVLCSGLYDDLTETPADYADLLKDMKARNLPMVCANPDVQVERGNRLIYCAGALAADYERLGGEVIYGGKPHPPIYDMAMVRIAEIKGAAVPRERILCIGDGIKTDMAGAAAAGMDALFITSALHVDGAHEDGPLDEDELAALFSGLPKPIAVQRRLAW